MTIRQRLANWIAGNTYTPYNREGFGGFTTGGQIIGSPDNKRSYIVNGFNVNDTLYSIIKLITDKVRVAPWNIYEVVDEEAMRKVKALERKKDLTIKERKDLSDLKRKALEPYTKDQRLNDIIRYPNDSQTFSDLVADSGMYKLLVGDRAIYIERINQGANQGKPWKLHLLPTDQLGIVASYGSWPVQVLGYTLMTWNWQNIPKENVIFDKFYNPNQDVSGMHLYGLSPLKAALRLIDRSNSENRAATASYQNLGPRYVVFTDDARLSPDVAGAHVSALKERLTSDEYSGADNYNKFATSGYKVGAVPIGLSPADLEIIESEQWSLRRFCNVYGVPSQLLNDSERATYNTVTEAEAALTLRCAMPLLNTFRDTFNRALYQQMGYSPNIVIDYDQNVYSELQEDQAKKWGWVKELPVTNGYKMSMMGLDEEQGQEEWMNQILVPSGYGTAQDYTSNETDRAMEEGNGEVPTNAS